MDTITFLLIYNAVSTTLILVLLVAIRAVLRGFGNIAAGQTPDGRPVSMNQALAGTIQTIGSFVAPAVGPAIAQQLVGWVKSWGKAEPGGPEPPTPPPGAA